jgi:hypothetical protein
MDPITLALLAAALTAGGVGANYVGAQRAQDAQAGTMRRERARESKLDAQAFDVNKRTQSRYKDFGDDQAAREQALTALYQEPGANAPEFGPAPSDSNITVQHEAGEKAKAKGYTDQQGAAKAKLLSFGDLTGDISRGQSRDATQLHGIEGFRRGSQGVLPVELDAAQGQGAGWRLGGDILTGLGSVATMGALSGATLPGASGILSKLGLGAKKAVPASNLLGLY